MRWIGIWRRKLPNFWRILTMLLRYRGLCTTSVDTRERSKFRISNVQVSTGLRFKSFSATLLRKCRWVWLTSCNKNMQWKYLARPKNELVLELQHFRWTRSVWQNLANQLTRYTYVYIYICLNILDIRTCSYASTYPSQSECCWSQLLHHMTRWNLLRSPQDTTALSVLPCCSNLEPMLLGQKKLTVLVVCCWLLFSLFFFSKVFKGWGFLFF